VQEDKDKDGDKEEAWEEALGVVKLACDCFNTSTLPMAKEMAW
jgi:hypothetical protein